LRKLSENDIMLLNALNFKKFVSKNTCLISPDEVTTMRKYADQLLNSYKKELEFCELMRDELPEYEDNIVKLQKNIKTITENIASYVEEKPSKLEKIQDYIECIEKNKYQKWIIFSDDDYVFDIIINVLKNKNIDFASMSDGTTHLNEKAVYKYKNIPECQILFINSMRDGCGLNLENTTHILFLHKINPYMVKQVIGRAQRPGRKQRLEIHYLYHKNETITSKLS